MAQNERYRRRWMALAVAALAVAAPAHADQIISPGKESIFVSASNVPLPTPYTPVQVLAGQLLKGKRKTVIEITATWTTFPLSTVQTGVRPQVNGQYAEPKQGFTGWTAGQLCAGPAVCTTTARFFFDIDEAELNAPGSFVGQPLNVTLNALQDATPGTLLNVVLEARVQKK